MKKSIASSKNVGYSTLMSQIALLQAQAETIRHKDKSSILLSIRKQMDQHGITVDDFQVGNSPKKVSLRGIKTNVDLSTVQVEKATRRKPVPKYQDPKTGQTWTGRGKTPIWMQAAILKGKTKEKFVIR